MGRSSGGGEGLSVEGMEDEPGWDRQQTMPSALRPSPLGIGGAAGTWAGGEGGPAEEEEGPSSTYVRQASTPALRPLSAALSPPGKPGAGAAGGAPGWIYKDWAGEHGPKTLLQLAHALQRGYFTPTLLVRKEGTDRWHTLRDVLDLRTALHARRFSRWKEEVERKKQGQAGPARPHAEDRGSHGDRPSRPATTASPASSPARAPEGISDTLVSRLFAPGGPDWFYIDMQGAVQGPFKSSRMAKWWANPQYRDQFASLRCRRGKDGPFQLLAEFSPVPETEAVSLPAPPPVDHASDPRNLQRALVKQQQKLMTQATEKAQAAEEQMKELQSRVEDLELENEQLRQSNEDTLMLRMQVEQLIRDKGALAQEVAQLRREKAGLEELLQYMNQFDVGEEGDPLAGEPIADEEAASLQRAESGHEEIDEATQHWLAELERNRISTGGAGYEGGGHPDQNVADLLRTECS